MLSVMRVNTRRRILTFRSRGRCSIGAVFTGLNLDARFNPCARLMDNAGRRAWTRPHLGLTSTAINSARPPRFQRSRRSIRSQRVVILLKLPSASQSVSGL